MKLSNVKKLTKSVISTLLAVVMLTGVCSISVSAADPSPVQTVSVTEEGAYKNLYTTEDPGSRWASPVMYNLHDRGDGTFEIVEYHDGKVYVDVYKTDSKHKVSEREITMALPYFGGFYSGSQYNFIVTGDANTEEDNAKTTIRVDKYTKDWTLAGSVDFAGNNTVYPFDAGSLRCAEKDGYLYIHTCHEMYTSDDGLNHQANMSFSVRISDMEIIDKTYEVTYLSFAYTSHSFNQFLQFDGDRLVAIDHGDAYERAVVLTRTAFDVQDGRFIPRTNQEYWYQYQMEQINLFEIPGRIGANMTGVSIGGFEVTDDAYIVSISNVDHAQVTEYTSFEMKGLEKEERNPVVLIADKDNVQTAAVRQLVLTDNIGKSMTCSAPYLVKLDDGSICVLWEEFEITSETYDYYYRYRNRHQSNGVKYCILDSTGALISDVMSLPDANLAKDSQPICVDGKVIWYTNPMNGERTIYTLDTRVSPFVDVKTTDPYFDAVMYVKDAGLFRGVSDTAFAPGTSMNRAMFVTVLGRLNGLEDAQMQQDERWKISDFKDVKTGAWYTPFVVWASANGIVKGYDNGLFGVNDKITIQQAVVLIRRFCDTQGLGSNQSDSAATGYADYEQVSSWAKEAMNWAIANKIYQPSGTALNPKAEATRALVAQMLYNLKHQK